MRVSFTLFAVLALAAADVRAQPNLPPPPPPPIGQPTDVTPPPAPPPPAATTTPPPKASATPPPPASARRAPPPPPPYRPAPRRREVLVVYDEPPARTLALTLNPLGAFWGRASVNVEFQLAIHHSLIASANALIFDSSIRTGYVGEGFGFATEHSSGLGGELGYHYWLGFHRSLRGLFLGPSLLFGETTAASQGDAGGAQGYWGLAFDFGGQEVLPSGFTIGAGGGVGFLRMASVWAGYPRFLVQLGWSF